MKKRNIRILVVLALVLLTCGYLVYSLYPLVYDFYHPEIGPRNGRVVDAVTGEPIEGAVVSYYWQFSGVFFGEFGARRYETTTDWDGRYSIPACRVTKKHGIGDGSLEPEFVLIYKDGYAAYEVLRPYKKPPVGRSFGYLGEKDQPYREHDNLVRLYPWKEGESHDDHYDFVWLSHKHRGELLDRELEKEEERAREEALARRKLRNISGRSQR
jgi:hypothetical protein